MSLPKTYAEIIEDTILTLNESIGSSRQAIWKAVSGAYPAADYKLFVVRLKKMREAGQIAQKGGKFRLEITYKHKLLKALEKGKSGKKVAKSSVSLKKGAKKTAAKKGKGAAKKATKKAQKERKAAAVAKRGKAGKKAGAKKGKAAAAKKGAKKASSGAGKKTSGSTKTQKKKTTKKTLNKKISAAKKAKNSRKGAAKAQKGKVAAGKPAKGGIQSKRKQAKQVEAAVVAVSAQEKQDDLKAAVDSTPKSVRGTSRRDSSAVALSNKKSGKKAVQASGKKSGAGKSTASKAIKKGASAAKNGKSAAKGGKSAGAKKGK
jgi:hypothetical protein